MKKFPCIFIFLFFWEVSTAQEVVINGINKNRPLVWEDFTGKPDGNSTHYAYTYWNINYRYKGVSYNGNTAMIKEPVFTLELDKNLSWVKQGKETPELLKHEQGHFDLGLLCQKEMIGRFNNTVFTRSDFREKLNSLFYSILNKYKAMGKDYDKETNHSKNQESQEKWNTFFASELKTTAATQ